MLKYTSALSDEFRRSTSLWAMGGRSRNSKNSRIDTSLRSSHIKEQISRVKFAHNRRVQPKLKTEQDSLITTEKIMEKLGENKRILGAHKNYQQKVSRFRTEISANPAECLKNIENIQKKIHSTLHTSHFYD